MNNHNKTWSKTEQKTLKTLYHIGNSDQEIAELLGRTTGAVHIKRNRMNLQRKRGRKPKNAQPSVRKSATYTRKKTISLLWGLIKIYR